MAFTQIGLGGLFSLNVNPAIVAMQQATTSLQSLQSKFDAQLPKIDQWAQKFAQAANKVRGSLAGVNKGMNDIAGGITKTALGAIPLSMVMKAGAQKAIVFEKQMSVVNSLLDEENRKLYPDLIQKAKWMGITSVFTAGQAAQAMEYMVRSGANARETMAGIGGVMNAAAADGIQLEQAANVVAIAIKSMGLEWKDAEMVADVLAKTSASANTNILALGESFVYGAATAKQLGVPIEQLSGIFGALGDAGLKGSMAGTSLTNMMVSLAKPSKEAEAIMGRWGVTLTDAEGKLKPWPWMVDTLSGKLKKVKNVLERTRITAELFGLRGQKAFNALAMKGGKNLKILMDKVANSMGAAADMADKRLDNIAGRWVLFMSAVEGAFIELFEPVMKPVADAIKKVTGYLSDVLVVIQAIKGAGDSVSKYGKVMEENVKKFGATTWAVANGVMDAVIWLKEGFQTIVQKVGAFFGVIGQQGGNAVRQITRFTVQFAVLGAIFAPVAGAVGLLVFVLKAGLWPIIQGIAVVAFNLYAIFIQVAVSAALAATHVLSFALNLGLQLMVAVLGATLSLITFSATMIKNVVVSLATGILWLILFGKTIFTEMIPALWDSIKIELWYAKTVAKNFVMAIWAKIAALGGFKIQIWATVKALGAGLVVGIKAAAIATWAFVKGLVVTGIPALIGFVKGLNLVQMVTLKGLIPALLSVGRVMLVFGGPILIIFGLIGAFLIGMGSKANSFKDTMVAAWTAIKVVVGGFVEGFMEGMHGAWFAVRRVFQSIYQLIRNIFGFLWEDSKTTTGDVAEMFKAVGKWIGNAFKWGFDAIAWFFEGLGDFIFEAQYAFIKFLAAIDEGWVKLKNMVGALSDEEYNREMRRIDGMTAAFRKQHDERKAQILSERTALKKLEEDEQRATETKKAMEKYIYADGKREDNRFYEIKLEPGSFEVNVNNKLEVDGKGLATTVTKHQQEIQERKGFKTKRWQMMAARETGAPVAAGGG